MFQHIPGPCHLVFDDLARGVMADNGLEPALTVEIDNRHAPAGAEIFSGIREITFACLDEVVGVGRKD